MEERKRQELTSTISKLKEVLAVQCLGVAANQADHDYYVHARETLLSCAELKPLLPAFLLECHSLRDFWGWVHSSVGRIPSYIANHPEKLEVIRKGFLPALDALDYDRLPEAKEDQTFLVPKSEHDGYVAVRDVLSMTKKTVLIADTWIDRTLLPLLTNLPAGTTVKVLTVAQNLPKDFVAESKKFSAQYGVAIEVRGTPELHDRFIIVDQSACSHFGASLKDLGKKAALISAVNEPAIAQGVVKALDSMWSTATIIPDS
jgi:hypothetical protein